MKLMPLQSWNEFKSTCLVKKTLNGQYTVLANGYEVVGIEEGLIWFVSIVNGVNDSDIAEFEANYKSKFNQSVGTTTTPFSHNTFMFDGKTNRAVVPAGTIANIDIKIVGAAGRKVNGGFIFAIDAVFGDEVTFQVVDVDNILGYGAGVVLNEFVTWSVDPREQMHINLNYGSDLVDGLYVRGVYKSVGTVAVKVGINLNLHRPI